VVAEARRGSLLIGRALFYSGMRSLRGAIEGDVSSVFFGDWGEVFLCRCDGLELVACRDSDGGGVCRRMEVKAYTYRTP